MITICYIIFGIESSSFGKGLFPFYESLNEAIPNEVNLNSSKEKIFLYQKNYIKMISKKWIKFIVQVLHDYQKVEKIRKKK